MSEEKTVLEGLDTPDRPGVATTEYRQAARAQITGELAMWLGIVAAVLLGVGEWLGAFEDGNKALWGALLIVVAGVLQQVLAANGYSKSRAAVKSAALKRGGRTDA